jgi:hypothetical protein
MPSPYAQSRSRFFAAGAMRVGLALSGLLISVTIMAQECPLSMPLTIKEIQSGFAGETGTVWTIAADCSYTVARQIGLKTLDPHQQGRLTPQERVQLKELLGRVAAAGLPKQLGIATQVNARRVLLSYDGKDSTVTLAPGGGDFSATRAAAGNDAAAALLDLADQVKAMTAR